MKSHEAFQKRKSNGGEFPINFPSQISYKLSKTRRTFVENMVNKVHNNAPKMILSPVKFQVVIYSL